MRSLICLAIVKKACSTLDAFLAEVSRKGIPRLSANSYAEGMILVPKKVQGTSKTQELVGVDPNLGNCVFHDFLVLHIALVADKKLVNALGGVAVDFLEPLLDIVERVHIRHIVHDANAMSAPVVGGCDGPETLLTSSIPLRAC